MNPLLQKLVQASAPPPPGGVAADSPLAPRSEPIKKINYSHRAMAQMIAANPAIHQNELAMIFGYSASWISTIMSTAAFQEILAEEMEKSPFPAEARINMRTQIEGLLNRSLEILREKLSKSAADVPDQLALQTAKMGATALGMGVKDQRVPTNEVHLHLEQLGENLVGLLRRRKADVLEGEVVEESPR